MTDPSEIPADRAAAELYARHLNNMGVIDTAWVKEDAPVVCATTHGHGVHLSNGADDYDADVHVVCETEKVDSTGNLPESVDMGDCGAVFFNVVVRGLVDNPTGAALPTHTLGRKGDPSIREDLDDEVRLLGRAAGLDL